MLSAQQLGQVPILSPLTSSELDEVARWGSEREVRQDAVVIREGDTGDCVFVVLSGSLKVSTSSPSGGWQQLPSMGPGELFGEIAVMDGRPRSATVVAATDARLLILPGWAFSKLLSSSFAFGLRIVAQMAARLRRQDRDRDVD